MFCKSLFAVVGLAAIAGSIAIAQPAKDSKPGQPTKPAAPATKPAAPAAKPSDQPAGLPPGMTEQVMKDMNICMETGKPGPEHAEMAKCVGTWTGKNKMWFSPEATEPQVSDCTQTITSIMDGRFIKIEVQGDMGGMPYNGFGVSGYDNVSKKYVSTWLDNCGSGMMQGTGVASEGGKVITFTYNYNCPITKKPATMREVHTHTSPDAFTLAMFGADPHSGKEFKMMEIAFTRKSNATSAVPTSTR